MSKALNFGRLLRKNEMKRKIKAMTDVSSLVKIPEGKNLWKYLISLLYEVHLSLIVDLKDSEKISF